MNYICPTCGSPLADGAQFCSVCGTIFETQVPTTDSYEPQYITEDAPQYDNYAASYATEEAPLSNEYAMPYVTEENPVPEQLTTTEPQKKGKKKIGLIIGGIVVIPIIIVIILAIILSGGDGDKKGDDSGTTKPQASQTDVKLSDNIYDFNINLSGVAYKFPETLANFEKNAWVIADDKKASTVNPQEYIDIPAKNDTGYITLHIFNDSDTAKKASECQVGGITLSFNRSNTYTIALSKALVLTEETTVDDIVALWGKYTHIEAPYYYYKKAETFYDSCEYGFETYEGAVCSVSIKNFDTDHLSTEGTIYDNIIIEAAPAATKLSKNLADGTISFDGKVLALPVKASEMTSVKDWKITYGPTKIKPNECNTIILRKDLYAVSDDDTFMVSVFNPTDKEIPVEDALVIGIDYGSQNVDAIQFANGIKLGMTEAEFLKAANNFELEKEERNDGEYTTIHYRSPAVEGGFEYLFTFRESKTLETMNIYYSAAMDMEAMLEDFGYSVEDFQ